MQIQLNSENEKKKAEDQADTEIRKAAATAAQGKNLRLPIHRCEDFILSIETCDKNIVGVTFVE